MSIERHFSHNLPIFFFFFGSNSAFIHSDLEEMSNLNTYKQYHEILTTRADRLEQQCIPRSDCF